MPAAATSVRDARRLVLRTASSAATQPPSDLEKIEIEVREIGDGVEPWRRIGPAEAGMLRDDHVERCGQPTHEGQPASGASAAVEKEHRTTGATAHDADAAIPDRYRRDGMIGHSPPRP